MRCRSRCHLPKCCGMTRGDGSCSWPGCGAGWSQLRLCACLGNRKIGSGGRDPEVILLRPRHPELELPADEGCARKSGSRLRRRHRSAEHCGMCTALIARTTRAVGTTMEEAHNLCPRWCCQQPAQHAAGEITDAADRCHGRGQLPLLAAAHGQALVHESDQCSSTEYRVSWASGRCLVDIHWAVR